MRRLLGMSIDNTLNELGRIATEKIINELIQQGHRTTGKLIDSVQYKVYKDLFEDGLEVSLFRYGIYVDKGVSSQRFKISRAYITAIVRWLRVKQFVGDDKKLRSIAWAIGKTHEKEGIPTLNSYQHSKNGRRLNFIGVATRDIGEAARKAVGDAGEKEVLIKIDNIIRKTTA